MGFPLAWVLNLLNGALDVAVKITQTITVVGAYTGIGLYIIGYILYYIL